jgi:hypothetical protein
MCFEGFIGVGEKTSLLRDLNGSFASGGLIAKLARRHSSF